MAEITNELMYELLKRTHQRIDRVDTSLGEIKSELQSIRGTMISIIRTSTTPTAFLPGMRSGWTASKAALNSANWQKHKQGLNRTHEVRRRPAPRPQP